MEKNIANKNLFIFAHPDDEALGASALLSRNSTTSEIVFVSDGMPAKKTDPEYYPPYTKFPEFGDAYKKYRQKEAQNSMTCLGISPDKIHFLDYPDSGLINFIEDVVKSIEKLITENSFENLYTHAYEGGHIDHDLVCFAVWKAVQNTKNSVKQIFEIPLYHFENGEYNHNMPLTSQKHIAQNLVLTKEETRKKFLAISSYISQREDTQYFDKQSPEYQIQHSPKSGIQKFQKQPHTGRLQYEKGDLSFQSFQKAIQKYL
jgi:LmbE family N-acetylglucosaminyl deacetylase